MKMEAFYQVLFLFAIFMLGLTVGAALMEMSLVRHLDENQRNDER